MRQAIALAKVSEPCRVLAQRALYVPNGHPSDCAPTGRSTMAETMWSQLLQQQRAHLKFSAAQRLVGYKMIETCRVPLVQQLPNKSEVGSFLARKAPYQHLHFFLIIKFMSSTYHISS